MSSKTKFNAGTKAFYTAEEIANIIFEDIPLPGESSDIDFSSDSENEEFAVEEQIVDDVEVLEEDSSSEYLSSSSESEDVDSERGAEEEIEDNSDVDTNNTPAQEKTPDAMEDSVAPHNNNADNTQGQQDVEYDVDQNRMWKKVQKAKFQPIFDQPQGKIVLIASAKIPECEGSISPSSFYGQLPDC